MESVLLPTRDDGFSTSVNIFKWWFSLWWRKLHSPGLPQEDRLYYHEKERRVGNICCRMRSILHPGKELKFTKKKTKERWRLLKSYYSTLRITLEFPFSVSYSLLIFCTSSVPWKPLGNYSWHEPIFCIENKSVYFVLRFCDCRLRRLH